MLPLDHETKLVQGSGSREGHGPMQTSNRELCVCSLGRGGHHATFVGLFPPSLYLVLCTLYPSAELWEENKKKVEMLMLNLSPAMLSHASYSCARWVEFDRRHGLRVCEVLFFPCVRILYFVCCKMCCKPTRCHTRVTFCVCDEK